VIGQGLSSALELEVQPTKPFFAARPQRLLDRLTLDA